MSIVLLTGDGPEHRYVANRLCDRVDIAAVVVETGRLLTRRQRIAQLRGRYSTSQLASRVALAVYKRAINDREAMASQLDAVLGPDGQTFRYPELVTGVETVNRPASHDLIDDLDPDRLLVYGTGIVGDRLLAKSQLTPLNLHTGISPYYRGSACAFWPIHNGEPGMCGATVHEICSTIDGGPIYATSVARLEPGDGVHTVFARAVVAGAELYAGTVADLTRAGGNPQGEPQDLRAGAEYRSHMRGLRAERRARRRLRDGLLDQPVAGSQS
jgi:methionyl-tRNA formyltransferase